MVAIVLPADPLPPDHEVGISRSKFDFPEHGHVAYQIKGDHECSNMVANFMPAGPPPPDPGDWFNRSKFDFFKH